MEGPVRHWDLLLRLGSYWSLKSLISSFKSLLYMHDIKILKLICITSSMPRALVSFSNNSSIPFRFPDTVPFVLFSGRSCSTK